MCHILHNLHGSINFIITDSQLSTYFWLHPISNCGWMLCHYTCMLSIVISLMYIWCCGSREGKTPVTVWWLHACANSTPYLSFSPQYTYHAMVLEQLSPYHRILRIILLRGIIFKFVRPIMNVYYHTCIMLASSLNLSSLVCKVHSW